MPSAAYVLRMNINSFFYLFKITKARKATWSFKKKYIYDSMKICIEELVIFLKVESMKKHWVIMYSKNNKMIERLINDLKIYFIY